VLEGSAPAESEKVHVDPGNYICKPHSGIGTWCASHGWLKTSWTGCSKGSGQRRRRT
jgi:hypothetical protein